MKINEEYFKGLPDFMIEEEVRKMVSSIRGLIVSWANREKSENPIDRKDTIAAIDAAMKELEDSAIDLVEDRVSDILNST